MIQISHACPPLTEYLFSLWAKISQPWTDCSAFCALRLWEWQIDLKVITHESLSCRARHWMLQIWNGNQENKNVEGGGAYFWILLPLPLKYWNCNCTFSLCFFRFPKWLDIKTMSKITHESFLMMLIKLNITLKQHRHCSIGWFECGRKITNVASFVRFF